MPRQLTTLQEHLHWLYREPINVEYLSFVPLYAPLYDSPRVAMTTCSALFSLASSRFSRQQNPDGPPLSVIDHRTSQKTTSVTTGETFFRLHDTCIECLSFSGASLGRGSPFFRRPTRHPCTRKPLRFWNCFHNDNHVGIVTKTSRQNISAPKVGACEKRCPRILQTAALTAAKKKN